MLKIMLCFYPSLNVLLHYCFSIILKYFTTLFIYNSPSLILLKFLSVFKTCKKIKIKLQKQKSVHIAYAIQALVLVFLVSCSWFTLPTITTANTYKSPRLLFVGARRKKGAQLKHH